MYAFAVSDALFVLCYLIGGFMLSLNVLHWGFYLFQILLSLTYTTWAICDLFSRQKIKLFSLRIVAFVAINYVVVMKSLEFLSNLWVKFAGNS